MRFYSLALWISLIVTGSAFGASSESSFDSFDHNAYANFGFWEGGIAFGGDYEYRFQRTFGLGATARLYSRDSDKAGAGNTSRLILGAFVRPHFNRRQWDFYVSPGFNILVLNGNDDRTVLGPSINYGLMYQIKRNLAFGVENNQFYCWFNRKDQGLVLLDLMLKGRFSF